MKYRTVVKCRKYFIAEPRSQVQTNANLMTLITIRILINTDCDIIRLEIKKEQCDFVQDTVTEKAIFRIRILSERRDKHRKNLYLCFIDYTMHLIR